MADLKGSPFSQACVPTPGGSSDWAASSGGFPPPDNAPGGSGLAGSPFSQKLVPVPSTSETPNSLSGLPTQVTTVQVEGAPGQGGSVAQPSLMEPRKVAD
jgi:hypothetical protein